jgi:hypothetical protein
MLSRLALGFAAALTLLVSIVAAPIAAQADTQVCDPVTNKCYTVIDQPGTDPVSNPDPVTGFTPGPQVCSWKNLAGENVKVPCSTPDGWWNNAQSCYLNIEANQPPAPPGRADGGAWYGCVSQPAGVCGIRDCFTVTFYSETPPPGINRLTPGQAAARLIATFQLEGINVGLAPDPTVPGSKSYVGVPIWMWVKDRTPLSYGPYTRTDTLGGTTITATARVTSILWNMGDGHTVACGDGGTPYTAGQGFASSPSCGYRYATTSDSQPGGKFAVRATSQWEVTWTGGGADGTVNLTSTSDSAVDINELQSVNVRSH